MNRHLAPIVSFSPTDLISSKMFLDRASHQLAEDQKKKLACRIAQILLPVRRRFYLINPVYRRSRVSSLFRAAPLDFQLPTSDFRKFQVGS